MCVIVVWGVGGGSLGWVWGWAGPESRTDAQRECEHPGGFSPLPLNTWSLWRVVFKDTLWRVVFKDTFYQAAVCAVIPVNLCAAVGFPSLWHFQLVLHRKYKKKKPKPKRRTPEGITDLWVPATSVLWASRQMWLWWRWHWVSPVLGTQCCPGSVSKALSLLGGGVIVTRHRAVTLSSEKMSWQRQVVCFSFFFFFPQSRLPPTLIPLFLLLSGFFCCFFLLRLLWWLLFGGSPPFPVLCWDPELSSLSAAWRMSYCAAKNCLKN